MNYYLNPEACIRLYEGLNPSYIYIIIQLLIEEKKDEDVEFIRNILNISIRRDLLNIIIYNGSLG